MERTMHRWQDIVPDLQASRLADPGEGTLHDPADLAQAAAVRCPLPCQVVLEPRSFRPCRFRGVPYCRSPYSAFGLRRGRPRGPRMGGMSSTRFIASSDSLRLAPVRRTASGVPLPSTSKCRLVPFLARSVGFLPVRAPQKRRGSSGCPHSNAPNRCPSPARPAGAGHAGASSRRPGAASAGAGASR